MATIFKPIKTIYTRRHDDIVRLYCRTDFNFENGFQFYINLTAFSRKMIKT